ncbi:MAG: transketolase [Candidatus Koribacter versatilis]|uniref:Transketolase n=1 Tax=Candidatus Korobacter versatilis TaxID=658062 RepID=A0A932A7Y4_9BACT|nr:transketolase [Candidatus Koribacter versatilis]
MMKRVESVDELKALALEMREDIVKMICAAGSGHPGGSLSEVELLTALYFRVLRHDPKNPQWRDRDRFILSKGHGAPALYAALAHAGYIPREMLMTLRKLGSPLQGHPDKRMLPILEASTGSLGQGISIGIGTALAAKLDQLDYHTFVMIGDGESQEGQIWEAAMFAPFHKLNNLTVIVDNNRQQLDDFTDVILSLKPFAEKWKSFGWNVEEINGHDFGQVIPALESARANKSERPTCIIANTVKGEGVSFMANNVKWHGVAPKPEERDAALKELEALKV